MSERTSGTGGRRGDTEGEEGRQRGRGGETPGERRGDTAGEEGGQRGERRGDSGGGREETGELFRSRGGFCLDSLTLKLHLVSLQVGHIRITKPDPDSSGMDPLLSRTQKL